jgi:hypothetical protein
MKDWKWEEHFILVAICKNTPLSIKLLGDIIPEYFMSGGESSYYLAVQRIKYFFEMSGRILSWKELLSDNMLHPDVIQELEAKEVLRSKYELSNDYYLLPSNYDQAKFIVDVMISRTQYLKLIDLHNSLSQKLQTCQEHLDGNAVDSILDYIHDSTLKVESLKYSDEEVLSLPSSDFELVWDKTINFLEDLVPTGFKGFDSVNKGIPKDSFVLISANSGAAKSLFSLQWCKNVYEYGGRACYCPFEMREERNNWRMFASLSGLTKDEIRDNPARCKNEVHKAWMTYFKRSSDTSTATLDIFTPKRNIYNVKELLSKLKPNNYDLIIIDPLQLLKSLDKDPWAKNFDLAGAYCKMWANLNNCIVAVTAQWDKESDHLRYGKALNEHCTNSFKWVKDPVELSEFGEIVVKPTKGRDERVFPFSLFVDPARCTVKDMDDSITNSNVNNTIGLKSVSGHGSGPGPLMKNLDNINDV